MDLSVVLVFVLTFGFQIAFGLRCFSCQSEADGDCGDTFVVHSKGQKTEECPGSCVKFIEKHKTGAFHLIARYCTHTRQKDGCKTMEKHGSSHTECFCNEDTCNMAPVTSASTVTLLLIFIAISIMYTFQ